MIQFRDRYIYCFGGFFYEPNGYEIEMLDTKVEDELDYEWQRIIIHELPALSNQILIPLKRHNQDFDRILIYGGVDQHKYPIKHSFICEINPEKEFNRDIEDAIYLKHSGAMFQYVEDSYHNISYFKLNKLPSWLHQFNVKVHSPTPQLMDSYYSENLLCFHGQNSITVIDIEKETTVFNSDDVRFQQSWVINQINQKKSSEIPDHKIYIDEQNQKQKMKLSQRVL